jgi:serine/threonine protein phosphatase PrpC
MPDPQTADVIVETCARTHVGLVRTANQDCFLVGDLDHSARLLAGGVLVPPGQAEDASGKDKAGKDTPDKDKTGKVKAGAPDKDRTGKVKAGKDAEPGDDSLTRPVGPRGMLWLVCDGMGGAAGGEVASELAAEVVWEEMHRAQATNDRLVYGRLLRRAVRVANLRIWEQARQETRLRGMGTTLSAVGLVGHALIMAQVGDSRVYLSRGQYLVQVTRDQSVAAALMRSGGLSEEEARGMPHAHAVLQAVGIHKDVEVALSIARLRRGDRVLICSDGLYNPLGDEVMRAVLDEHQDVRAAADALIEAACRAGGPDNVTAVLLRIEGEALPFPHATDVPRFTELDPMEEGERALVSTGVVARRLAAQLGIGDDPGPPLVPPTGQHTVPDMPPELQALIERHTTTRASTALDQRSRLGPLPWIAAAILVVTALVLIFWP